MTSVTKTTIYLFDYQDDDNKNNKGKIGKRKNSFFENINKDENEIKEFNNRKMQEKIEGTIQRQKDEEKKVTVEEKVDVYEEPLNSEDDEIGLYRTTEHPTTKSNNSSPLHKVILIFFFLS